MLLLWLFISVEWIVILNLYILFRANDVGEYDLYTQNVIFFYHHNVE